MTPLDPEHGERSTDSGPDEARVVYDGRLIGVTLERWGEHEREIVEHPGAVAIVAVDDEGFVSLVRQLREPARKRLLELPAGTAERGEAPLETARRELREECGLTGGEWRELGVFWTTPGFCRERMHVFAAEGVARGAPDPEQDEDLEIVRWPLDELDDRLGEIEDAKTLAGLMLFVRTRRRDATS
jgi:ADP-ribose diphosphatase